MHHQHGALFFLNPIWLAFIFLVLQLFWLSDIRKFSNIFIYLFIGIFYTYSFFPISARWQPPVVTTNFDDNPETNKSPSYQAPDTLFLSDYHFINSSLDTIQFRSDREYTFLETWNETCAPCIRSFRELSPFLKDLENVQFYYLYEHSKPEVRKKFDKIFSYAPVPDSSRILIDINQELFNAAGMQGYPYFLLFNPEGEVVFAQAGYKSFYLETMKTKILEALRQEK
jgi:thiol-disulfide isomerase/thioredoxin